MTVYKVLTVGNNNYFSKLFVLLCFDVKFPQGGAPLGFSHCVGQKGLEGYTPCTSICLA